MENLHAMESCRDRLRPYSVSSPLNSLGGRAESVKISCHEQHRQQAADDPNPALAARLCFGKFPAKRMVYTYRKKLNKGESMH